MSRLGERWGVVAAWWAILIGLSGLYTPVVADWPGWRGDGSGVAVSSTAPTDWTDTDNVR